MLTKSRSQHQQANISPLVASWSVERRISYPQRNSFWAWVLSSGSAKRAKPSTSSIACTMRLRLDCPPLYQQTHEILQTILSKTQRPSLITMIMVKIKIPRMRRKSPPLGQTHFRQQVGMLVKIQKRRALELKYASKCRSSV